MTTSKRTKSGGSASIFINASRPDAAVTTRIAFHGQQIGQQLHIARRVVDDKDFGRSIHSQYEFASDARNVRRQIRLSRKDAKALS